VAGRCTASCGGCFPAGAADRHDAVPETGARGTVGPHTEAVTSSEPGSVPGTSGDPAVGDPLNTQTSGTAPAVPPAGGGVGPAPPRPSAARRGARATGRGLFLALLIFVTVVLVLFVVFNIQTVAISLVFTDVRMPLVLALLAAAVLGGLVVGLAALVRATRRRSRGTDPAA
jgi:uncharacterized integral membrane protein